MRTAALRFRQILLSCLALLTLSGVAGDVPAAKTPKPVASARECAARGGEWILYPMGRFHFCLIKTRDAGKPCSDDGQCQGDCIPAESPGKQPGVCAPTLPTPGGCPKHLVKGKLIEEPCI